MVVTHFQDVWLAALTLRQRAALADLAISVRSSAVINLAREGPPKRPPLRTDSFRLSGIARSANAA